MIKLERGVLAFSFAFSLPEWLVSSRIMESVAKWGAFRRGRSNKYGSVSVEVIRRFVAKNTEIIELEPKPAYFGNVKDFKVDPKFGAAK